MLRKLLVLLLFAGSGMITLTAQNPVQRDLGPFSELIVGDRIIVRLVKAEKESALIQVQGINESSVKTEINGNVLQISIYGEPFTKKKVMVTLNYVNLKAIAVTGGADVTTTSLFKAGELSVDLKSGGMLYLDADIENLKGKLVEGALLTAEGYANSMEMTVSTTATLSAYDLECEMVTVKATSGGKAKVNVENELDAEASSKGFVSYKGNPVKITRNAISGGTISSFQP
jgi:hypothetical protein